MTNIRSHYFPENHCRVFTGLCAKGGYVAHLDGSFMSGNLCRGYGHSRFSAIADLVEVLGKTQEEDE